MKITRIGSQPSGKGPENWFTGPVHIDPLFQPNEHRRAAAALVAFEPNQDASPFAEFPVYIFENVVLQDVIYIDLNLHTFQKA